MSSRKKSDDPQIQKLQKNIHAGHRQRMRRRLRNGGLHTFEDYEALEMLLFYAIPRRNTNEIAHMLIRRFGSLHAALDAPPEELQAIPGVGPNAAQYIRIVPPLAAQITMAKKHRVSNILDSAENIGKFLADRLTQSSFPMFCLLLLGADHAFTGMRCYPGAELPAIRTVVTDSVHTPASYLVMVECGTRSDVSDQDHMEQVRRMVSAMRQLELPIWDYYLLPTYGDKPISLRRRGQFLSF